MRHFLMGMICVMLGLTIQAQDDRKKLEKTAKNEKKGPAPAVKMKTETTLRVGDTPPAIQATKWLKGPEVNSFEKGRVYVVEFWATWSRSCVEIMPQLSELQKEFADKGLIVIGFSTKDTDNTQSHVDEFLARRGAKFPFAFAFADNRDAYDKWVTAAGQRGMPCSFVIDKKGKIAYIGNPMFLSIVLPKVVAGTWNAKTDGETIQTIEKETNLVFKEIDRLCYSSENEDAPKGLKVISEFQTKYPALGKNTYFVWPKINMMLKDDQNDEVKIYAEKLIAAATRCGDSAMLEKVAHALVSPEAKQDKELAKIGLEAANKMVAVVGDKDLGGQITLAHLNFIAGKKDLAKKHAENVLELAPERSKAGWKQALSDILNEPAN